MNGYEPGRTDKNGAPSAPNVHTTPFLSVRIRSYPFKQEPHVSAVIPKSSVAKHNRQGIPTKKKRFQHERIPTDDVTPES
jgi:hypothetical protein